LWWVTPSFSTQMIIVRYRNSLYSYKDWVGPITLIWAIHFKHMLKFYHNILYIKNLKLYLSSNRRPLSKNIKLIFFPTTADLNLYCHGRSLLPISYHHLHHQSYSIRIAIHVIPFFPWNYCTLNSELTRGTYSDYDILQFQKL
jgi:hypothetical protein